MGAAAGVLVMLLLGVSTVLVVVAARATRYRRRYRAITSVEGEVARLRVEAERTVDGLLAKAAADIERLRRAASQGVASVRAEAERVQSRAQHELATARSEVETLRAAARADIAASRQQFEKDSQECARVRAELERLQAELKLVEGDVDDVGFGLYRPHYRFDTTEEFERELAQIYQREKEMIRAGAAAVVQGTIAAGNADERARLQKQRKLLLRAFNGEADAAIAKVEWNNATQMEQRIRRAFETINQLGEAMKLAIAVGYRDLKLAELRLEHELATRRRGAIEDQRWFREQMKHDSAELANAGYVYVVSNVGAFGPATFKIGMTRRLDPMDLVKELGDASVPYPFDVHAMIYADDAVGLERAFHERFADNRVNLVDERRAFFRVALAEIEQFARERGVTAAFTRAAEAREYRESMAMRATPSAVEPDGTHVAAPTDWPFHDSALGTDRFAPAL